MHPSKRLEQRATVDDDCHHLITMTYNGGRSDDAYAALDKVMAELKPEGRRCVVYAIPDNGRVLNEPPIETWAIGVHRQYPK